jgi:hypothetical protein
VAGEAGEAGEACNRTSTCTVPTCLPAPESQSHGLRNHHVILPIAKRLLVVDLILVVVLLRDADEVDEVLECLAARAEEDLELVLEGLSELDRRDLGESFTQPLVRIVAR